MGSPTGPWIFARSLAAGRVAYRGTIPPDALKVVELPSEVVPGSYAWSPEGHRAAFLTRSGTLTALCLIDADADFRYLAARLPDCEAQVWPDVGHLGALRHWREVLESVAS